MDKQVEKTVDSEQGKALVAGSSAGLHPKNPDPNIVLTKKEIFDQALGIAYQNGGCVDDWVGSIKNAISSVNAD
ncbi:hypothetical protein MO867_17955 [Microbulbifer sp. OS29]|uniref:Uncharacterized protein n=1 Tax=Microbulbifer okhotskensis TaxID=2926617 RepID=A0A9X2EUP0_9GAMM|nr:hypothetical protein [Microbulbifer okhotskensis]MCO1336218.1 hypothetical protein [Microbulbifer okhotskensis]